MYYMPNISYTSFNREELYRYTVFHILYLQTVGYRTHIKRRFLLIEFDQRVSSFLKIIILAKSISWKSVEGNIYFLLVAALTV